MNNQFFFLSRKRFFQTMHFNWSAKLTFICLIYLPMDKYEYKLKLRSPLLTLFPNLQPVRELKLGQKSDMENYNKVLCQWSKLNEHSLSCTVNKTYEVSHMYILLQLKKDQVGVSGGSVGWASVSWLWLRPQSRRLWDQTPHPAYW